MESGGSSLPGRGGAGEGTALLAVCAVLYWLTTQFDSVPAALSQNVPPEFFPRLLLAVISALSVVLIVQGGGKAARRDAAPPGETRRGIAAAAAAWLGCALFHFAGAPLAMVFSCVALPIVWGERRRGILALYALGIPAAVYVIFTLLLEVRFPEGVWN